MQNFNTLDIAKFLLSILLVCAHTASERVDLPPLLDAFCSFYIIAVPFFFIASSFLFFRKIENLNSSGRKETYKKYTKRIGLMYFAWSLVYFCFVFISWIEKGFDHDVILKYIHHSLVFSTYPTIWFLPSLWVGVSLVYLCRYVLKLNLTSLLLMSFLFYCVGAIEYTYHSLNPILDFVNDNYKLYMVTWRNGIFNAFVFTSLGCVLGIRERMKSKNSLFFSILFGVGFIAEAYIMKGIVPSSDANFLFLLIPFSFFFFDFLCGIDLPDNYIYVKLRKMSMLIFLSQRLFLTAIPSILPHGCKTGPWDFFQNGLFALVIVVAEVCLFSLLLLRASEKSSFFKILV